MSTSLGIALNVIADAGLVGLLAWVLSRTGRLAPHEPAAPNVEVIQLRRGPTVEVERRRRAA
jgi:uncharacterized membrane protein